MAIILKHKKTLKIQRQKVHHSEQVQTASIKYTKIKQTNKNVQNYVQKEDKFITLLTEENGRKNPFNPTEVKHFEV